MSWSLVSGKNGTFLAFMRGKNDGGWSGITTLA